MLSHKIRHLRLLLIIVLVIPAPVFNEVVDDELYAPTGFFMNLVYDGKHFLLLRT